MSRPQQAGVRKDDLSDTTHVLPQEICLKKMLLENLVLYQSLRNN
jgi:hypothetical protein